ncbi:MmgE/PrpD family protein [Castellaniella sp. GW247-6E4]|uniref:MmgE/PrpD family protein n=1 Tax=Castellaniella sp. GW247-6E4 TaxID=3140380 RepID=UPI003315DF53
MAGEPRPRRAVTAELTRFVAESRWEDLPAEVRRVARRSLLNFFAVALAGCGDGTLDVAVRAYQPFFSSREATLIGRAECADMLNAAALNAMSANVFDYDDTHLPTVIHPTAPVAAAILAWAETQKVPGPQFLHALTLGMEVECRIGLAISPGHYARGWHITSTCGVFGAAIAAGLLMRLDARRMCWALGSAAAQSAGLVETLGTMSKSVSVGNAARNGLLSAWLASRGFAGPDQPLEGRHGFLAVACDAPDENRILQNLGARWEVLDNTFKPYPCGVVLNPVIEACLELRRRLLPLRAEIPASVEWVELRGHSLLRQRTDRPLARTGRESQVSAQHAVAVVLMRGSAELADFSDEAVADPGLRALGSTVRFQTDDSMPLSAASVTVKLRGAPAMHQAIEVARGSVERPLSDQDLRAKLVAICRARHPAYDPAPLIAAIEGIEQSDDVGGMMRMARLSPT